MEAIYIPRLLKAREKKEELKIQETIPGLNTLTPIRGVMVVRHGGNFLEVSAQAETIVTLSCDRCLQNYNYRLSIDTSEIIWLEKETDLLDIPPQEKEVPLEDLSETLPPDGYFQPDAWLYEQLSLAMPMRQLCGENCQGPSGIQSSSATSPRVDSRWAALEALKNQLSGNNSEF